MKKKSLFIAVPAYDGNMKTKFAIGLMQFLASPMPEILEGSPYLKLLDGESHIDRARNRIAHLFLKSDKSHLLFLDSDVLADVRDLELMLSHDEDIVCGLYPKKTARLEWVINALDKNPTPDAAGLVEIMYGGTGCMLISRKALEEMIERRPEIAYEDDSQHKLGTMWNFFDSGIRERRWLSEDWAFCHEWRKLGGKIWADCRVQCKHVGAVEYPLPGTYRTWEEVDGWFDFQGLYAALSSRLDDGDYCVEVGCWQGRSTLFLAEEIRKKGIDAKILAVDTWRGSSNDTAQQKVILENGGDIFHLFEKNVRAAGMQHIIEPMRMASRDAAASNTNAVRKNRIKWVFIDGDHTYEAVKRDIHAWVKCVHPDGILAGHDIGYPEVRQAVEESFSEFKCEGACWYAERKNYVVAKK